MSGLELPVDHPTHDVALGEHPTEPLAVDERDDPDIVGAIIRQASATVVSRWSMKISRGA
jgi:hypothetical protein